MTRSPPAKRSRDSTFAACTTVPAPKRRSPRKFRIPTSVSTTSAVTSLMLTAYSASSPYALRPPDMEAFESLVSDAHALVDTGVPDNTLSNENSAWCRYWLPFCLYVGCNPERPAYLLLGPQQIMCEADLKACALPWIHVHMRGIKHATADPNSAMQALRSINRVLNRLNGEKNTLSKAQLVLKGILTEYVIDYGPIQPHSSVPVPLPVIEAMLALATGTKLGSRTLDWSDEGHLSVRTAIEVGCQSGVRLDEITVGRSKKWDKRRMSRAHLTWLIAGELVPSPSRLQLQSLTADDGAYLRPACSKCDRWGTKHGGKPMFFPYRPQHVFNACRALRDVELHFPVRPTQRATTPLLTQDGGHPLESSYVRTMLHHMLNAETVRNVTPQGSPKYTFHSLRKFYCTSLARANVPRERIQSMVRWLSPEAVDVYDKLSAQDHTALIDSAYVNAPSVTVTPEQLARLPKMDDNDVLLDWSRHCSVDIEADPQLDWS